MHVDMTFPTTVSRNMNVYTNIWWPYAGFQNIFNIQRLFWVYPLLIFAKVFHVPTNKYLLLMFWGTFSLAGISAYAFTYHVVRRLKLEQVGKWVPVAAGMLAAVVYMYNPWSLSHMWTYFGYPGYALLPLVFLLLMKAVDKPGPLTIIGLALVMAVASTGPICTVWFWIIVVTYLLFDVAIKRFSKKGVLNALKVIIPAGALYALVSASWLVPYAGSIVTGKPFVPPYVPTFTPAALRMLSASNTVANNLRLTSGWGMPVNANPTNWFWAVLSFAIPVAALAALLGMRMRKVANKAVYYWTIVFAASVLLATGSSFILKKPYEFLVFNAPGSASFGWVMRVPDRWLVFAPIFYALMAGVGLALLLKNRSRLRATLGVVLAGLLVLSLIPVAVGYAREVYNPTEIPGAYAQVNDSLTKAAGNAREVWLPFFTDGFRYKWAGGKRIGGFSMFSSNPNLNNFNNPYDMNSYFYWLSDTLSRIPEGEVQLVDKDLMLRHDIMSGLLAPFTPSYMVFDSSVPYTRFGDTFASDSTLERVMSRDMLDVYRVKNGAPMVRAVNHTVRGDTDFDYLSLVQGLPGADISSLAFTDARAGPGKEYGTVSLDDYKVPVNPNPGFEASPNSPPLGWEPQGLNATWSVSSATEPGSQGSCLKVENRNILDYGPMIINGADRPAQPGGIYTVDTRLKYRNADWTYVAVEGLSGATGKWKQLLVCPAFRSGTSSWKKWQCSFVVPEGITRIRPRLAAGWAKDTAKGGGVTWFDEVRISRVDDSLHSALSSGGPSPSVTYEKLSPEKYKVRVKGATKPFVLVFGEAYDRLWTARLSDGKNIEPVPLYSLVNGFPIDKTGSYDVTIEYPPQRWFHVGLLISLLTLFACLLYALVAVRRRIRLRRSL